MRITKSEISMRTWRSPMSATSQGAFAVIPEISLCDISYIIKKVVRETLCVSSAQLFFAGHISTRQKWTKVRITKSEISMRTWRSPMSATSQGTFVVIPEISHSDISYIIRRKRETLPSALLAFYF